MPVGNTDQGKGLSIRNIIQNDIMHFGIVVFALTGKTFTKQYRSVFQYILTTPIVSVLPEICYQICNKIRLLFYLGRNNKIFSLHKTSCLGATGQAE